MSQNGGKAIGGAAIAWVMELERKAGRAPVDGRYERAFAGDIWGAPRTIELKPSSSGYRGWFVPLQPVQLEAARTDPEFYVYRGERRPGRSRAVYPAGPTR